jgi:hypothetical protein
MYVLTKEVIVSIENIIVALKLRSKKIKHFISPLLVFKIIEFEHPWGVFLQRNHKPTYLTSSMGHVQSFKILSTNHT